MNRFYIEYLPSQVSHTGSVYLDQFVNDNFKNVKWVPVISDGILHYGFLEGSGEDLCKCMISSNRFSIQVLSEKIFVGACYSCYKPVKLPSDTVTPSFKDFMASFGVKVTDELDAYKAYKLYIFKKGVEAQFLKLSDSVADSFKILCLLNVYKDTLTKEEKSTVDSVLETIKSCYSKDQCIKALNETADMLKNILPEYYKTSKKMKEANEKSVADNITYLK